MNIYHPSTTWKRPAADNHHLETSSPADVDMENVGFNVRQVLTDDNSIRLEEDQNSKPSSRDGVAVIHKIPSEEATYDWLPINLDAERVFGDIDEILLLIAKEN